MARSTQWTPASAAAYFAMLLASPEVAEELLPLLGGRRGRGGEVLALEAGRVAVHEEQERQSEAPVRLARAGHHQNGVSLLDAGDERLLPAQDPPAVVAPRGRREVVRVRPRVRLGYGEGELCGPAADAAQPALLLVGRAVPCED